MKSVKFPNGETYRVYDCLKLTNYLGNVTKICVHCIEEDSILGVNSSIHPVTRKRTVHGRYYFWKHLKDYQIERITDRDELVQMYTSILQRYEGLEEVNRIMKIVEERNREP